MIDATLRSWLACPACHGDLRDDVRGLVCPACSVVYPVEDDLPIMLIDRARPLAGPAEAQ